MKIQSPPIKRPQNLLQSPIVITSNHTSNNHKQLPAIEKKKNTVHSSPYSEEYC